MTEPESFPVEDARKKFADILDGTQFRNAHAQITRRGKRAGYVVPPEWYDSAIEALAQIHAAATEESAQRPRPAAAAPRQQVTQAVAPPAPRRPKPEPRDGRPLTDEEAATLAAKAFERASEMQGQKLRQLTANTAKGYEDFAIVSTALDLGLLTHDEVYGPVSSEEQTA
jgi:hypothetical protein